MKVAVIGAWHVHTREYTTAIQQNPKAELCCLWDDDQERGKAMAEKFGIPFQPDLQAIWDDESIDAVSITTATCQHTEVLMAAAKAKKHIFTEKVLAFTNEEAEQIAKARVHNYHNGSTAGWLPPHFYDAAQTGGGAMMDLGAHPMYTLNWFLGEPKSVVSMFTTVTGKPVEDNAVSVIEFANGTIGVSETGFVTTGIPYVMEMSGTKGSLMVHNNILEYSCEETENQLVQMTDLPEKSTMPIDAWIDAVNGIGEAPNGVDDAVALTKFMVGAYESFKTGKKYTF